MGIVLSTSTASIEPAACGQATSAAGNRPVMAGGSPRSGSGEMAIDWSCRIGSDRTTANGKMSSSRRLLSGGPAASAVLVHSSSARVSLMGSRAGAGWASSPEPESTFSAAIVIGSPTLRSAKIATSERCGGPTTFGCGLAESPVLRRRSRLGQGASPNLRAPSIRCSECRDICGGTARYHFGAPAA